MQNHISTDIAWMPTNKHKGVFTSCGIKLSITVSWNQEHAIILAVCACVHACVCVRALCRSSKSPKMANAICVHAELDRHKPDARRIPSSIAMAWVCPLCLTSLNSVPFPLDARVKDPNQGEEHLVGKKHKKALERARVTKVDIFTRTFMTRFLASVDTEQALPDFDLVSPEQAFREYTRRCGANPDDVMDHGALHHPATSTPRCAQGAP